MPLGKYMHTLQKTITTPSLSILFPDQTLVRKPQFKVKEKSLSNPEKKFNRRGFHFKDDGESWNNVN